jgi:hypothetical protein
MFLIFYIPFFFEKKLPHSPDHTFIPWFIPIFESSDDPKEIWLVVFRHPSENYESHVTWDDDILIIWKNNSHVPNHQPEIILTIYLILPIVVINLVNN